MIQSEADLGELLGQLLTINCKTRAVSTLKGHFKGWSRHKLSFPLFRSSQISLVDLILTTFLDQPIKKFKSAFTTAIQNIKSQGAAQSIKIERIVISDEDDVRESQMPINDMVNSEQSDDENYAENIQIPKKFRQKMYFHKSIAKKQSTILIERCSNTIQKGKV